MSGRQVALDSLTPEQQETVVSKSLVDTMGHLVTANILSRLQIMKKSDYAKELEKIKR